MSGSLGGLLEWRMVPVWICLAGWLTAFGCFMYWTSRFAWWQWVIYLVAWQVVTLFTAAMLDPERVP